jgi:cytochrome c-type biogenesis protein CcmH/NrfG
VTPGPTLPAFEQLGDLLMKHKQPAEALVAYQRAIELYPRRFNGLLGAARAAREAGKETEARNFYGELLQVSERGVRREALDEARSYLGRTPQ